MGIYQAYAPPMIWGPWVTVASHLGSVTYKITSEPVGDTVLECKIRYFKGPGGGTQVEERWVKDVTITTSDSVANVEVSFKGVPTGSKVEGTVSP